MFERAGRDFKKEIQSYNNWSRIFIKATKTMEVMTYFKCVIEAIYIDEMILLLLKKNIVFANHILVIDQRNIALKELNWNFKDKNEDLLCFEAKNKWTVNENSCMKFNQMNDAVKQWWIDIKNKWSIYIYKDSENYTILSRENEDLIVQQDLNHILHFLNFYSNKNNGYEISKENIKKLTSATKMHILSNDIKVLKEYSLHIQDWECTIKEVNLMQVYSDTNDYVGLSLLFLSLPQADFNILNSPIDFMKVDKGLGFNRMRISTGSSIATIKISSVISINIVFDSMVWEFTSFSEDPLDNNKMSLGSPRIISLSNAKLNSTTKIDHKLLLLQLFEIIESNMYSWVSIKVDVSSIKTFENPCLYQIKWFGDFKSLEYCRFMIKDIYWTSLKISVFIEALRKLKLAKTLDVVMMKEGYRYISKDRLIVNEFSDLNIRKLSLIKINTDEIIDYNYFLDKLSKIKTLKEIEYSYDGKSNYSIDIGYRFADVKTTNFTGTKKIRRRRIFSYF